MDNIKNYILNSKAIFEINKSSVPYYFSTSDSYVDDFSNCLLHTIMGIKGIKKKKGIVIVCIGTDKSTGDCLGPLLGYKLKEMENDRIKVFGTLKYPIHALNLDDYLAKIKNQFHDWVILAVDASVGIPDHVGLVTISKGSLAPGSGVGKNITSVGDVSITGIVTSDRSPERLLVVRLSLVMDMVEFLYTSLQKLKQIFKSDNESSNNSCEDTLSYEGSFQNSCKCSLAAIHDEILNNHIQVKKKEYGGK
ncbi:spore protease YyaC [Hungatella hathewayi]|uniref:spore protease YyaC n=1 Tax=Hungatella hathewayi TaxID=154046 RepID=UPI003566CBDC